MEKVLMWAIPVLLTIVGLVYVIMRYNNDQLKSKIKTAEANALEKGTILEEIKGLYKKRDELCLDWKAQNKLCSAHQIDMGVIKMEIKQLKEDLKSVEIKIETYGGTK